MGNARSFALVLAGALAFARGASAQTAADADSADALFKAAKAAMERGDLSDACPQFAESQRLDPAAGTLLNLAECEARQGKVASALGRFQEARAALPAGDYRITFAEEKIGSLSKRVSRLSVKVAGDLPAGARVQRDGITVAPASLGMSVPVDPGLHVMTLTVSGREVARMEVKLAEGQAETAELAPGVVSTPPVAAAPREPGAPPATPQKTWGLTLIGTGVAGLAAGAVLGIVAKATYDSASSPGNCPSGPTSCNADGVSGGATAHIEAGASTAAFIAGGILGGAGALLYFTAPKEGRVGVAPVAGPAGAGLSVRGIF